MKLISVFSRALKPSAVGFSLLSSLFVISQTASADGCGPQVFGPKVIHAASGSAPKTVKDWNTAKLSLVDSLLSQVENKALAQITCPLSCPHKLVNSRDFGGFGLSSVTFYLTDGGSSECGHDGSTDCCKKFNKDQGKSLVCPRGDSGEFVGGAGDPTVTLNYSCGENSDPVFE